MKTLAELRENAILEFYATLRNRLKRLIAEVPKD